MRAAENPFATHHLERVPLFLSGTSVGDIFRRLFDQNFRGSIIGPRGTGKSLLLSAILSEARAQGEQTVTIEFRTETPIAQRIRALLRLATSARRTIAFLDGEEQLTFFERALLRLIAHRIRGVVTTAHTRSLFKPLHRTECSLPLFAQLVEAVHPCHSFLPEELREVFVCARGNAREALLDLYDRLARRNSRLIEF